MVKGEKLPGKGGKSLSGGGSILWKGQRTVPGVTWSQVSSGTLQTAVTGCKTDKGKLQQGR